MDTRILFLLGVGVPCGLLVLFWPQVKGFFAKKDESQPEIFTRSTIHYRGTVIAPSPPADNRRAHFDRLLLLADEYPDQQENINKMILAITHKPTSPAPSPALSPLSPLPPTPNE